MPNSDSPPPRTITVARRYRGPDQSGNGGYVCGLLAGLIEGPAEVTLKAPPPLDTPLLLERDGDGARLTHNGGEIAIARPVELEIAALPAPALETARAASLRYAGFNAHLYPECFVCGPRRDPGDGLHIYAGPNDDQSLAAATWVPAARDADEAGAARREIIWAALDCPSYFALMRPGLPALLGRMAAHIIDAPRAGETCIVAGWPLEQDGRKHHAASAIYSEDGRVLARAKTTWIELRQ